MKITEKLLSTEKVYKENYSLDIVKAKINKVKLQRQLQEEGGEA